jgi:hypothetical protein
MGIRLDEHKVCCFSCTAKVDVGSMQAIKVVRDFDKTSVPPVDSRMVRERRLWEVEAYAFVMPYLAF